MVDPVATTAQYCVLGIAGAYALGGGLLSLAGWATDTPQFSDWDGDGIAIQPNAAVAAACAGGALLALIAAKPRVATAFSTVVLAIALVTAFEYIFQMRLGNFDTWLMFDRAWGDVGTLSPGRMGPPASISWLALGTALTLIATSRDTRLLGVAVAAALFALTIASLSIVGYLYDARLLYTVPTLTVIAFQTATFVAAVAVGTIVAVPERAPMRWLLDTGAAGTLARRFVPFLILVPVVLGSLQLAGEAAGLYDRQFGTAALVLLLMILSVAVVVWAIAGVARNEVALRASERRFRQTLEQMPDGFLAVDLDWHYRFINAQAARMMGKPVEGLLGRRVWDEFPESAHGVSHRELHRALRESIDVEFEAVDAAGRWYTNRAYPTEAGIAVYFSDITERKETELRLRADVDALRRVQALSTRLIRTGDLDALLSDILAAVADLLGTAKGNIQFYDAGASSLCIVVHRGHGAPFVEHFTRNGCAATCGAAADRLERVIVRDVLLEPGLEGTKDLEVITADGIRAIQSTPLLSRTGRLLGMLSNHFTKPHVPGERDLTYVDLFARMAADVIERSQSEASAAEADRRKDEFIATLAHELRGPLAPMSNAVQLLNRAGNDLAAYKFARDVFGRQIKQMVRLVDDLLDVSRIARDKLELRKEDVDLGPLIDQAVESVAPLVTARGHVLDISVPPQPLFVRGDRARLVQVVTNLLNNACKYTHNHGRIELRVQRDGSDVVIGVKDDGIGIPAAALPTVFDMFSQVGRSTEDPHDQGLGIGLHLVKHLVELHGGSVRASSGGMNRGSEFTVRLPLGAAIPRTAAPVPPSSDGGGVPAPTRRFLIVEDNVDSAASLQSLLSAHGHDTYVVHDGLDTVELVQRFKPHVVLLDLGLPGLNGYEVCRRLRAAESWSETPVMVAVTGWGQEEDRRKSTEAGFDLHLVKPIEYQALVDLVDRCERSRAAL